MVTPLDLDAITLPCVLTYRFTVGGVSTLVPVRVTGKGVVHLTSLALAWLEDRATGQWRQGHEGPVHARAWRTVHELVTAHGGELIEVAPW